MHRPFVTAVPSVMVISAVVLRRYCAASSGSIPNTIDRAVAAGRRPAEANRRLQAPANLVAGEEVRRRATVWLPLEIDVSERQIAAPAVSIQFSARPTTSERNHAASTSRRIISGPTDAKVNFARSSFGRLRIPSPNCSNTQRSCASDFIGPTFTIFRSSPTLPQTGHRQRRRTS